MKYSARDTRLPEMPVLTKYESAYRAQRRAIARITRDNPKVAAGPDATPDPEQEPLPDPTW